MSGHCVFNRSYFENKNNLRGFQLKADTAKYLEDLTPFEE